MALHSRFALCVWMPNAFWTHDLSTWVSRLPTALMRAQHRRPIIFVFLAVGVAATIVEETKDTQEINETKPEDIAKPTEIKPKAIEAVQTRQTSLPPTTATEP